MYMLFDVSLRVIGVASREIHLCTIRCMYLPFDVSLWVISFCSSSLLSVPVSLSLSLRSSILRVDARVYGGAGLHHRVGFSPSKCKECFKSYYLMYRPLNMKICSIESPNSDLGL
ncbi:hypothetical protein HS088_TW18G00353 [Tripterygium wilfordii]|uniref:Uncharacterized protein n=1 Tax=Tripterygium wilfordii TaxID=458696 RepID=A0A7J7CC22_TRIWF|nr:hypothetical protein HS088_TW18G00353 [Tripterygium wilfordii]